MVEISREERDAYLIPQNFVDTGTILGGTVKLRNAVEAAVLAVGSAIPLFYLPMAFNIRLMIVIAVSVPLGVFGVVGIGGDSLTQFVAHWFRFMKRRRIVTPTPQGNLEANRHRHLRLISKRYRVVYYDDSDTLPHNAQVLQRKADRHGKLVKRQTLYDLLPIEKIENGILHTTDDRYIKILEIEPINFLLRSPREQRSVIYSFASLLKVSPVRLQFKSFSRKADVNAYLDKLRRDAANEPDAAVRKRHITQSFMLRRVRRSVSCETRFMDACITSSSDMAASRSSSCCSRSFFCACFASHSALRLASAASNSAFLRASSASSACGSGFGGSTGSNSSLKESTVSLSEDTSKASSSASRFIISISDNIPIVLSFLKKAESRHTVALCHNFCAALGRIFFYFFLPQSKLPVICTLVGSIPDKACALQPGRMGDLLDLFGRRCHILIF